MKRLFGARLCALSTGLALAATGLAVLPAAAADPVTVTVAVTAPDGAALGEYCQGNLWGWFYEDEDNQQSYDDYAECSGGTLTFENVPAGDSYQLRVYVYDGATGSVAGDYYYFAEPAPHLVSSHDPAFDWGADWFFEVGAVDLNLGTVKTAAGAVVHFGSTAHPDLWAAFDLRTGGEEGYDSYSGYLWPESYGEARSTTVWPGSYVIRATSAETGVALGYLQGDVAAAQVGSPYLADAATYEFALGTPTAFDVSFVPGGNIDMLATGSGGTWFDWYLGKTAADGFAPAYWESGNGWNYGFAPGEYVVPMNRQMSDSRNAGGYFAGDGKQLAPQVSAATPVTVAAGETTELKPALAPCATVSGTLVGANPAADHYVEVYPQDEVDVGRMTYNFTGLDYTVTGLWPGKWTVEASESAEDEDGSWTGTTWYYNPAANDGSKPAEDVLEIASCEAVTGVDIAAGGPVSLRVAAPVISGTPQVGSPLNVAEVATTPPGGAVSYAWLVDDVQVKAGADAAARTYTPAAADLNKQVKVRVTATRAGYNEATAESAAVTVAAEPTLPGPKDPPANCGLKQVVLSPRLQPAGGGTTDSGDGQVVRICTNGDLWLYNLVADKLSGIGKAGSGFGDVTVYAPGDWDKDGLNDLIGVDRPGLMWLYKGKAGGGFAARTRIGSGWGGFKTIVPVGDITGDGNPDLLAVQKDGVMKRYEGNGRGGWKNSPGTQAGSGWRTVDLLPAGDVTGDGNSDIFGLSRKTGELNTYAGRGNGSFRSKVISGRGWRTVNATGGASLNGDAAADLIGVGTDGTVNFYRGRGNSTFTITRGVATGWK
ncbi:MAG: FG-GAP-like repeat-containing protein [Bifidobacteriaceae bacterium]|jgi:hypothetical protein|nr:FG-GAP-like repeat-containing protein [Bifidobacteriaceae bacterium]